METIKSTVTYDDKVIEKIIGHSLENVGGLLAVHGGFFSSIKDKLINSDDVTKGIAVEVGSQEVATDLSIIVEYGKDIPAIVESIKAIVVQNVALMTHLKVVEVNVRVVDIKTKEEHAADSVTVQDRLAEAGQVTGDFVSQQADKAKAAASSVAEKSKELVSAGVEKVQDLKAEPRTV